MNRNLTEGKPLRLILSFFVPLLLGNLFQQLYNMADTFIVGRYVGVGALAAVGSTGSLSFMVIGFTIGMCTGFSIPVAQAYGAGDLAEVRRCIIHQIYLAAGMTVLVTLIATLGTRPMLHLLNTPADIFEDAYAYIFTIFAGIGATILYNTFATISRAVGDSRTPLNYLFVASGLNIGLDILFILAFGMGVRGAAYATVISQLVAGALCMRSLYKKYPELRIRKDELAVDPKLLGRLMGIGMPMALQFSITAIGSIMVQGAINGFGSTTVAAVTAASKVQQLLSQPQEAMGAAMAPYCGQNLGASRLDRIKEGVKLANLCTLAFSALGFLIMLAFGNSIVSLFLSGDAAQIQEIMVLVRQVSMTNASFFWLLGILLILRNALQGVGYTLPAMLAGVVELVGRALVAFVLVKWWGFTAICFANTAAWICAVALLIPMYIIVMRKLTRKEQAGLPLVG